MSFFKFNAKVFVYACLFMYVCLIFFAFCVISTVLFCFPWVVIMLFVVISSLICCFVLTLCFCHVCPAFGAGRKLVPAFSKSSDVFLEVYFFYHREILLGVAFPIVTRAVLPDEPVVTLKFTFQSH